MTDVFVHHRISFDEDMSCDEEEDNSSEKSGATSSSNSQSGELFFINCVSFTYYVTHFLGYYHMWDR